MTETIDELVARKLPNGMYLNIVEEPAPSVVERIVDVTLALARLGAICYLTYIGGKLVWSMLDANQQSSASKKAAKKALADRLKRPDVESMEFDSYEQKIMVDVIGPDEIDVSFADIGGMDAEIEEVRDNVVLPFQIWKFYKKHETISTCPTGVLLYGAPGTGKSLTAKAIAKGKFQ